MLEGTTELLVVDAILIRGFESGLQTRSQNENTEKLLAREVVGTLIILTNNSKRK